MQLSFRAAMRAASYPLSRFRSIEERLGIIGFTLAILFVMTQSLMMPKLATGPAGSGNSGGYISHGK